MPHRFSIYVEDEKFLERLRQHKPATLSLSSFLGYCAEKYLDSLDSVVSLPAYRVGSEDTICVDDSVSNEQKHTQGKAPKKDFQTVSLIEERDGEKEDGVGRESEGNPRKEEKRKGVFVFAKSIPSELEWCRKELLEFWNEKGGKKSQQAGTYLCNQLIKLAEKYGERVVLDQLELATAKGFDSISVRNYEMFGLESNKPQNKTEIDWEALDKVSLF